MTRNPRMFALLASAGVLLAIPATAWANVNVTVLGLRSVEGDDAFALSLTGALRHAASQVPEWDVSGREVSLAQMSLAHGCDEPDASCLAQIAETLEAQRILYGTVRRTSAGSSYDFEVTLSIYNAETGQIEGTVSDSIPRSQSDVDQLRDRVRRYMAQLSGSRQPGMLRVVVNVPGAEILVDGASVGFAADSGEFTVEVPSGSRRVEVIADGYEDFRGSVTVVEGSDAELEVTLQESGAGGAGGGGGPSVMSILGWTALGLAAVSAGLTIWSWTTLNGYNEVSSSAECAMGGLSTWSTYRCNVPERIDDTPTDACAQADMGTPWRLNDAEFKDVQDNCSEISLHNVLQYVFLTSAVVLGGTGVALLLMGGSDDDEEEPQLSITPTWNHLGGRLDATLRF